MFNFKFYTPTKVIFGKDPKNYDARAEVMWAGSLAHKCAVGVGGSMGSAMVLDEKAMLDIYKAAM